MDIWKLLHLYRKMSHDDKVPTLDCPDCDKELVWTLGKEDEPVGWCVWEDTKYYPGTVFWDNVKRIVEDNELE